MFSSRGANGISLGLSGGLVVVASGGPLCCWCTEVVLGGPLCCLCTVVVLDGPLCCLCMVVVLAGPLCCLFTEFGLGALVCVTVATLPAEMGSAGAVSIIGRGNP